MHNYYNEMFFNTERSRQYSEFCTPILSTLTLSYNTGIIQ